MTLLYLYFDSSWTFGLLCLYLVSTLPYSLPHPLPIRLLLHFLNLRLLPSYDFFVSCRFRHARLARNGRVCALFAYSVKVRVKLLCHKEDRRSGGTDGHRGPHRRWRPLYAWGGLVCHSGRRFRHSCPVLSRPAP